MNAIVAKNCQIIDQLVLAYNAHSARAFADFFAPDAFHGALRAETAQHSREEIYQRYVEVFSQFPENSTEVVHRIAFGDFVVDHEIVRRSLQAEPFEVVAIYTLKNGLIQSIDFVR